MRTRLYMTKGSCPETGKKFKATLLWYSGRLFGSYPDQPGPMPKDIRELSFPETNVQIKYLEGDLYQDLLAHSHDLYRTRWMSENGFGAKDLIRSLWLPFLESGESLMNTLEEWEKDGGFSGKLWPSLEEFESNIFPDRKAMLTLLKGPAEREYYSRLFPEKGACTS